jgi:hypothetical protein
LFASALLWCAWEGAGEPVEEDGYEDDGDATFKSDTYIELADAPEYDSRRGRRRRPCRR